MGEEMADPMEVDDAQHEESAGDPAPEQGTGEMMGGGEAGGDHHKQQQQQQQNQGHQQGKGEEETFVRKDVRPQWPPEQETRKQSTIVIQPGSEYLRIGWAGDEAPRVVPHCLARLYRGDMEEPASSAPERERERERELADVERTVRKWSGPTQKRSGLGGETVEEEIADAGQEEAFKLLGVEGGEEGGAPRKVFYGEEAQKVTKARRMDGSRYVMKRLVQRGRVHVTSDGVEAALCDFQGVWEHAIRDVMGHDLSQLENNLCVLVIPSNVCKMDVKFYMTLLLQRMRCRGVCVLQDSVSACYASSIITSCVVDIGHQKTSVSIVEDGVCIPATCQMAPYGGDDVGRTLEWLLRQRAGVLAPLDLSEPSHEVAMRGFKERICYFVSQQQDIQTKVDEMVIHRAGHPAKRHTLKVGSAACTAPMGLFHPKLLQPADPQRSHRKPWSDPEEVCDDEYIAEMISTRPGGSAQTQAADDKLILRDEHMFPADGGPLTGIDTMIKDAIARAKAIHVANLKDNPPPAPKDGKPQGDKAQEAVQKLYSNIVIVGGGSGIQNIAETLQQRVMSLKPQSVNSVSVQINPRDRDSQHMAWAGGGIIPSVDSFKEVFVSREEWELKGVGILREKVMFPW